MRKSQISIEFMFTLGIIFFIFLIIFGFIINRRTEVKETEDYLEKRAECMKISSMISSVFAGGDGTIAKTKTKYLITIFNYSLINVEEIEDISTVENKIAVLASEAGETSQTFYDVITNKLDPDWYKICFSDISGDGCQKWTSDGLEEDTWDSIDNDIHDLIETIYDNPNAYQTIYLEDSTMQYNAIYNDKTYLEILQDWVAGGNIIILSEHVMCREGSSGSYPSTSYRCNPPGYNSDVWDIFDVELHQLGGSFGNDVTVIIEPDLDIFPNLDKDDTFDFEEESYIEELSVSSIEESEDLGMVGGFTDTTNCICSSPSNGYCIRHVGSTVIPANTTWTSDLEGNYNIKIVYCGENDGNDEWWVYKNDQQIDNWVTSYQSDWQERTIESVHLSVGDELKLSCDRGTSSSYCRSDYIEFELYPPPEPEFIVVAEYDNNNKPAIVYWDYGDGKVFYFGDFQVEINQGEYSDIISDVIERGYYSITTKPGKESCSLQAKSPYYQVTGNITIKNRNGLIIITNETIY